MNGDPIIETNPSGLYIKFNYKGLDGKLSLHYTKRDCTNRFHLTYGGDIIDFKNTKRSTLPIY